MTNLVNDTLNNMLNNNHCRLRYLNLSELSDDTDQGMAILDTLCLLNPAMSLNFLDLSKNEKWFEDDEAVECVEMLI